MKRKSEQKQTANIIRKIKRQIRKASKEEEGMRRTNSTRNEYPENHKILQGDKKKQGEKKRICNH